jgi:hypothetical protein
MRPRKKKETYTGLASQLVACEESNEQLKRSVSDYRLEKSEIVKKSEIERAKLITKNTQILQQNAILMAEIKREKSANRRLREDNVRLRSSNAELTAILIKVNRAEVALKQLVGKRLVSAEFLEKITNFKEKFLQTKEHIAETNAKITDIETNSN